MDSDGSLVDPYILDGTLQRATGQTGFMVAQKEAKPFVLAGGISEEMLMEMEVLALQIVSISVEDFHVQLGCERVELSHHTTFPHDFCKLHYEDCTSLCNLLPLLGNNIMANNYYTIKSHIKQIIHSYKIIYK